MSFYGYSLNTPLDTHRCRVLKAKTRKNRIMLTITKTATTTTMGSQLSELLHNLLTESRSGNSSSSNSGRSYGCHRGGGGVAATATDRGCHRALKIFVANGRDRQARKKYEIKMLIYFNFSAAPYEHSTSPLPQFRNPCTPLLRVASLLSV